MRGRKTLTDVTLLHLVQTVSTSALLFVAAACASAQSAKIDSGNEPDLDRLVRSSRTEERGQWFPAAEKLGQAAEADNQARDEIWARARVNSLGMKFIEVKAGSFTMGPALHRVGLMREAQRVKISKPYFISATEVTNAQFQKLFPDFQPDATYSPDPDSPAVNVEWSRAEQFCKQLSARERATYRLPTEAEWEYACRAGSTTRFYFGDDVARLPEYGWCDESLGRASRVAMLKPNAWGIYDMHGNVFEWASEWLASSDEAAPAVERNGEGQLGQQSVQGGLLRSGPWASRNPGACTSTAWYPRPLFDRKPFDPNPVRMPQLMGLRVVRELSVTGQSQRNHPEPD
jgi:formylglycine-generating enzyme required for sulfatase activity